MSAGDSVDYWHLLGRLSLQAPHADPQGEGRDRDWRGNYTEACINTQRVAVCQEPWHTNSPGRLRRGCRPSIWRGRVLEELNDDVSYLWLTRCRQLGKSFMRAAHRHTCALETLWHWLWDVQGQMWQKRQKVRLWKRWELVQCCDWD